MPSTESQIIPSYQQVNLVHLLLWYPYALLWWDCKSRPQIITVVACFLSSAMWLIPDAERSAGLPSAAQTVMNKGMSQSPSFHQAGWCASCKIAWFGQPPLSGWYYAQNSGQKVLAARWWFLTYESYLYSIDYQVAGVHFKSLLAPNDGKSWYPLLWHAWFSWCCTSNNDLKHHQTTLPFSCSAHVILWMTYSLLFWPTVWLYPCR